MTQDLRDRLLKAVQHLDPNGNVVSDPTALQGIPDSAIIAGMKEMELDSVIYLVAESVPVGDPDLKYRQPDLWRNAHDFPQPLTGKMKG